MGARRRNRDTFEVPEHKCPACGKRLDSVTEMFSGAEPQPGDCTICLDCGAILIMLEDLTTRRASDAETARMLADPEHGRQIRKVRQALSQFWVWQIRRN